MSKRGNTALHKPIMAVYAAPGDQSDGHRRLDEPYSPVAGVAEA